MPKDARYLTIENIEKVAKTAIGKTFNQICDGNFVENNSKGGLGTLIEENLFKYKANNDDNPDFVEAGIELKVTPYKKNKNQTYSSKERLVLNIINYNEEVEKTFYTSKFWQKNKKMLIMFYEWIEKIERKNLKINFLTFFEFTKKDLEIIQQDWEKIHKKIVDGKAHEISESDTNYLAACTKGADSSSDREQPNSKIRAKQRAYSLKSSYMSNIIRKLINSSESENESLVELEEIKNKTFEEIIIDRMNPYRGKTVTNLVEMFHLERSARSKHINMLLTSKMLGLKGNISNTEEFLKSSIVLKTIRVQYTGKIKESMSFPAFKFTEIVKETWEESSTREMFESKKYMFTIFKQNEKNGDYRYDKVVFWNIPINILDTEIKSVWEKTVEVIKSGKITKPKKTEKSKRTNNFPSCSDNPVCHVRPHGKNALDVYELPVKDVLTGEKVYTKQSFWLNNSYMEKIIK